MDFLKSSIGKKYLMGFAGLVWTLWNGERAFTPWGLRANVLGAHLCIPGGVR